MVLPMSWSEAMADGRRRASDAWLEQVRRERASERAHRDERFDSGDEL
jgi:hypothetical protein